MSPQAASPTSDAFDTSIPARLDRLPWGRFHWLIVVGLGITWVLDGLEVTLMGAISAVLQRPEVLNFSAAEIGSIGSAYLTGAVLGSLVFGHLTDRYGRRKFFFISLSTYLVGVVLTALSWNWASFALFRFLTGVGIGGEYSAVNSAIDELIPARFRGRVDLMINGSFWLGAAAGAASTVIILNPHILPLNLGWRFGFGIGGVIGLVIIEMRRFIPESPRWLVTHGDPATAERLTDEIEREIECEGAVKLAPVGPSDAIRIRVRHHGLTELLKPIVTKYRVRSFVGLSLMVAQAFVYNAIFFTYALVLNRYYGVSASATGLYLLPFAISNFIGPMLLGHFFDTIGRRQMIAGTYAVAGLLLALNGYFFFHASLSTFGQIVFWTVIFFFASPAASAAYLTVSEIFPLEMRALAISIFYSAGTAAGGIAAPWFFGRVIDSNSRGALFAGYLAAAFLMLAAATIEATLGIAAERVSLEQIAEPLSAAN